MWLPAYKWKEFLLPSSRLLMGLATKGNVIVEDEMKAGVTRRSRLHGLSVNSQSSTYCFPQRDFLKAPNLWGACAEMSSLIWRLEVVLSSTLGGSYFLNSKPEATGLHPKRDGLFINISSMSSGEMVRMPCCDKAGVKKGPWSQAEDLKLISFIQQHGHDNWRALPKLAGLARCGKSCRLRWINYLRPDLKRGNFTLEEEESIIKLHEQLGNKWSKIASHLPGRTDNEIKNVWNTHLKKRSMARGSQNHPPAKPNDSFTASTSPTSGEKMLDDTIEFSSSSSTSYQMDKPDCCDDNGIVANVNKQDLLGEVIEIPFEPNLDVWEWLDVDSNCAEGYVLSSEAAAHQQRASDDDSSKGVIGRSWWFEYLENELGLGATTPDAYPDDVTDSALQKFLNEEELLSDPIKSFADMSTFT